VTVTLNETGDTMYAKIIGEKYEATKDLRPVEIAALFRAELKAAVKAGELPKLAYSVRCRNYNSIAVRIGGFLKAGLQVTTLEAARAQTERPTEFYPGERQTPAAAELVKKLEGMLAAYNFDRSEIETDYFNVRFYSSVEFDWEERNDEAKLLAAGTLPPAPPPKPSAATSPRANHVARVESFARYIEERENEESLAEGCKVIPFPKEVFVVPCPFPMEPASC
jgi:hypothetical protein